MQIQNKSKALTYQATGLLIFIGSMHGYGILWGGSYILGVILGTILFAYYLFKGGSIKKGNKTLFNIESDNLKIIYNVILFTASFVLTFLIILIMSLAIGYLINIAPTSLSNQLTDLLPYAILIALTSMVLYLCFPRFKKPWVTVASFLLCLLISIAMLAVPALLINSFHSPLPHPQIQKGNKKDEYKQIPTLLQKTMELHSTIDWKSLENIEEQSPEKLREFRTLFLSINEHNQKLEQLLKSHGIPAFPLSSTINHGKTMCIAANQYLSLGKTDIDQYNITLRHGNEYSKQLKLWLELQDGNP